jgi:predicted anti-sigma-YlaC factor YlaD
MNHQPFEEWLLADEPIAPEQAVELREHLRDCPRCRELEASWTSVHKLIQTSEQIDPTPGFTSRWQVRLHAQQQQALSRRFHRQPWLLLVLNLTIAAILLILLSMQLWRTFHTPQQFLLVKAFILSIILTIVDTGQDILTALIQITARFPVILWVFLLGLSGFLGSLWITVGRQIASTRRISYEHVA